MAALNKLLAKAGPEEVKVILGWICDFRRLIISLPENKFIAWRESIENMILIGKTTAKELERTIGRLVHVGMVLPKIHHFLSRLRDLQWRAINRRSIKINQVCIDDLKLMLFFLDHSKQGIDMNLLAYRKPTKVYRSDSCPHGLGGYSSDGWAWRWYLPQDLLFRASNNLLEHLASIVTVWIDIIEGRIGHGDCTLSMTDSTTSEGWSKKTNFSEDIEDPIQSTIRIEVARSHAMRMLKNGIKDYSQWFPGKENDVSDALSRDMDRSNEELTNILHSFVPSQMPNHFRIVPLPNEISSWLTSLLLRLPVKEQLQERHTKTILGRGSVGNSIAAQSELKKTTASSMTSLEEKEFGSWEPLPWLSMKDDFQDRISAPWLRAQSEIPFHFWLRPSEKMTVQTPQKTRMVNLADFYLDSSDLSETTTQIQSSKKPSQQFC